MPVTRRGLLTLASSLAALLAGCAAPPHSGPGPGLMSYADYRNTPHPVPYILDIAHGGCRLLYYGAAHFNDPSNFQAADIQRRWTTFRPALALNEGGDPPVEASPDIAIGRHAEAGLLRWLAHRDAVPVRSLDPTREQEVAALRDRFTPEQLVVFYVLRAVMQDARRAPEFRAPSIEQFAERRLAGLTSSTPGLETAPRTLAEFEAACRRLVPQLTDWRTVPPSWFDPALEPPPVFTNSIARASSEFRDAFIMDTLVAALAESPRVFAVVGASHVVMQEPELRRRFERVSRLAPEPSPPSNRTVVSLLGTPLTPPPLPEARRAELSRKLIDYTERAAAPGATEDDFIWLGRTLAYLHRHHDAIDAFARGLDRFPASHTLLRHRGHRFITIRDFPRALADLQAAARLIESTNIPDEVEPDGAPNRSGIPRSTINTNIYYHLGLAHYLTADFPAAAASFQKCLDISPNDDMTVAAVHWLYMSRCRLNDPDRAAALAPVHATMQILENDAYFRLCRMYQGVLDPAQVVPRDDTDLIGIASVGYGISVWHASHARPDEASSWLERTARSPMWPAFGVIAAEADLARQR